MPLLPMKKSLMNILKNICASNIRWLTYATLQITCRKSEIRKSVEIPVLHELHIRPAVRKLIWSTQITSTIERVAETVSNKICSGKITCDSCTIAFYWLLRKNRKCFYWILYITLILVWKKVKIKFGKEYIQTVSKISFMCKSFRDYVLFNKNIECIFSIKRSFSYTLCKN